MIFGGTTMDKYTIRLERGCLNNGNGLIAVKDEDLIDLNETEFLDYKILCLTCQHHPTCHLNKKLKYLKNQLRYPHTKMLSCVDYTYFLLKYNPYFPWWNPYFQWCRYKFYF